MINNGFVLIATAIDDFSSVQGGLDLINDSTVSIGSLHLQQQAVVLVSGSSGLNVSRDLYVAEFGTATLSLTGHSNLDVGTQYNQNIGGTLALDLAGWPLLA